MTERKSTKMYITEGLNSVDVFDEPIFLNLGGERKLSSSFGGFISLAFLIFMAVQTIIQFVKMIKYEGPAIIQFAEYQDDPHQILLNETNNFVMAVGATVNNNAINMSDSSIVSFTSFYSQYYRQTDGTTIRIKAPVSWAPCKESNFPTSVFPEGTFTTYNLQYAYCPNYINFTDTATGKCPDHIKEKYSDCISPPYFGVKGTFLSQHFEFVQMKLYSCSQSHSNYIKDLNCASLSDISNIFTNSEAQLNLYFANNLIDPVNHQMPNKTFLDTIYWNIDPSISQFSDIFIDGETVQDFDRFLNNDAENNSTFYGVQVDKMRELEDFKGTSLLTWNLRRSNTNHVVSRNYVKFLDVISNIGGIGSLIMVFGFLLVFSYNKFKYQMILSNELYDYQPLTKKKHVLKKSVVTPQSGNQSELQEIQEPQETEDIKANKPLFAFLGFNKTPDTKNTTVRNYFETQKRKQRKLPYGEFRYIQYLCRKICRKEEPEDLIAEKARKQVIKDIDIIKIIEKLQEIDKMKNLLLNKYQREVFNFIEKPVITMDDHNPVHKESEGSMDLEDPSFKESAKTDRSNQEFSSLSKYAKLYAAYKHLMDDLVPSNQKYNKKLLDMIGPDLLKVFQQVDQIIGKDTNQRRFEEVLNRILNENVDNILATLQK